jgi:PAS domain S-box-containing protein
MAAVVLLVNLFVMALAGLSLYQSYGQYQDRATVFAVDLARLLEQNINDAIDKVDLQLLSVADEMARQRATGKVNATAMNAFIDRQRARVPDMDTLRTVEADGTINPGPGVAPRQVNIAERDYFELLHSNPQAGLAISKPVLGYISAKWVIIFARRIPTPNGEFGGLVYASVTLEHFLGMFSSVDVGAHGVISLRDNEFNTIMRHPELPGAGNAVGQKAVSQEFRASVQASPRGGSYMAQAGIDSVERMFAFRRIANHPLYVIVGLSTQDYLGEWHQDVIKVVALVALFAALTLFSAWMTVRAWHNREQARHDSEIANARLTAVLQNSPIGLAIVNPDRVIELANAAVSEIFEVSGDCLIGKSTEALYGSHEQFVSLGERARIALLAGETFHDELLMRRRDGSDFWLRLSGRMVEQTAPEFGYAWVIEDISERKQGETALRQQEERMRLLVETTADWIWEMDERCIYTYSSPQVKNLLGYEAEEIVGKSPYDLMPPDEACRVSNILEAALAARAPLSLIENTHRHRDGRLVVLESSGIPVFDEAGAFKGYRGIDRDITARISVEQALIAKSNELSRSNAELEQFAYVASHDLREPLRMISSYVTLLERRYRDKLDSDAHEFIAFAKDGAERMDRLILDLLEYSRIGRLVRPMEIVHLGDAFNQAVGNLAVSIADTDAIVTLSGELPDVVGDPVELMRLFQNLIGNAIKYHRASHRPEITVKAERHGQEWHIGVTDNGIGIAASDFDRIFGIFQRLHARGEYEGTGIGLAICRKIVQRHGGRIWVLSEPDKGSTFMVALPVIEASPAQQA